VLPTRQEPAPSVIALLEQITRWCRPDGVVILDDSDGDHAREFAHTVRRAYPRHPEASTVSIEFTHY
jgi:hypothetical protein